MTHLSPGDRVQLIQNSRRLKFIVDENWIELKTRGEDTQIPCRRLIQKRSNRCNVDTPGSINRAPKIRWIERSKLRKLPPKS